MKLTDEWFTAMAEDDNSATIIICGRDDIDAFRTSGKFKERLEVSWQYAVSGMPTEEVAKQMEEMEELLRKGAEKDKLAILTGIYTGGGKRVWVFYSRHTGAFGEMLNTALSGFELLPITIYSEKDPDWDDYAEISSLRISGEGDEEQL
ncbi:MAG: DUF695 domain-containing protein [Bacteroidales bacterium]